MSLLNTQIQFGISHEKRRSDSDPIKDGERRTLLDTINIVYRKRYVSKFQSYGSEAQEPN